MNGWSRATRSSVGVCHDKWPAVSTLAARGPLIAAGGEGTAREEAADTLRHSRLTPLTLQTVKGTASPG